MSRPLAPSLAACLAIGAAQFTGAPAEAQMQDAKVGTWSVSGYTKDGAFTHCGMSTRAAHGSRVLLFYIARRSFQLAVHDRRWNLATGTRFDAFYQIDGGQRIAVRAQAVKPTILNLTLAPERVVFEQFRTASTLLVGVPASPEFDGSFNVAYSAAAFDRLYACARAGMAMARARRADGDQQVGHTGRDRAPPSQQAARPSAAPPKPAAKPADANRSSDPATTRPATPPAAAAARPGSSKVSEPELIGSATGFYVSAAGHILTAAHVIRRCKTLRAQSIGDVAVPARLVAASDRDDLALLKAEAKKAQFAPLRAGSIRLGEQIVLFGFPHSGALASSGNLTTGNVAALAGYQDDHREIQVSAPAQPGNSGGPVLDLRGRVAGVLVSGLNLGFARRTGSLPQNISFAVKSSLVTSFLEAHGVSASHDGAAADLPVPDVAERARSFTVRIDCLE